MGTRGKHYQLIVVFICGIGLTVACSATKKEPASAQTEIQESSESDTSVAKEGAPAPQKEVVVREVVVREEKKSSPLLIPVKIVTTTVGVPPQALALALRAIF